MTGALPDLLKYGIDFNEIERRAIEFVAAVLAHVVLVLFVPRVRQRLEEVLEATGSARVLGWTSVFASEAESELECVGCAELGLDGDGVLPAVAEVILIGELALPAQRLKNCHGLLVDLAFGIFVETHSIASVTDVIGV